MGIWLDTAELNVGLLCLSARTLPQKHVVARIEALKQTMLPYLHQLDTFGRLIQATKRRGDTKKAADHYPGNLMMLPDVMETQRGATMEKTVKDREQRSNDEG